MEFEPEDPSGSHIFLILLVVSRFIFFFFIVSVPKWKMTVSKCKAPRKHDWYFSYVIGDVCYLGTQPVPTIGWQTFSAESETVNTSGSVTYAVCVANYSVLLDSVAVV